jgi:hypothetical protein
MCTRLHSELADARLVGDLTQHRVLNLVLLVFFCFPAHLMYPFDGHGYSSLTNIVAESAENSRAEVNIVLE